MPFKKIYSSALLSSLLLLSGCGEAIDTLNGAKDSNELSSESNSTEEVAKGFEYTRDYDLGTRELLAEVRSRTEAGEALMKVYDLDSDMEPIKEYTYGQKYTEITYKMYYNVSNTFVPDECIMYTYTKDEVGSEETREEKCAWGFSVDRKMQNHNTMNLNRYNEDNNATGFEIYTIQAAYFPTEFTYLADWHNIETKDYMITQDLKKALMLVDSINE